MKSIAVGELWDILEKAQIDAESGGRGPTPLAEGAATVVPSWDAMRGRRTVRDVSHARVALERIALVLSRATGLEREQFGGGEPLLGCLALLATDTLVDPLGRDATAVGRPLARSRAQMLRATYCDAPVLLFFGADLASALSHDGVHGYRRSTMRAGAVAHATWLAAREEGLEGSVYGRTSEHVTRLMTETHGTGWRHVFTLALGEA
ncbi:nitroreductase family protein [Oerskovia turbata]